MQSKVDISGLDKQKLLRALWDKASPAAFFGAVAAPKFEPADQWRLDYHCGRCIKADLRAESVDPYGYDNE